MISWTGNSVARKHINWMVVPYEVYQKKLIYLAKRKVISYIIVVIGSHIQIRKKVIRQRIRNIAAVELQSKKLSQSDMHIPFHLINLKT